MSNSDDKARAEAEQRAWWESLSPSEKHRERCVGNSAQRIIDLSQRLADEIPQEIQDMLWEARLDLTIRYRNDSEIVLDEDGVVIGKSGKPSVSVLKERGEWDYDLNRSCDDSDEKEN